MRRPYFLPARESELVSWSNNFSAKISASPAIYGLTAGQAAAYAALHASFAAAFAACNSHATNSQSATVAKNTAKKALLASARQLSQIVHTFPGTTNYQRSALRLSLRLTAAPIPAPVAAPGLTIVASMGHLVRIRLYDFASPTRRGKPPGVQGASVFSFVGASGGGGGGPPVSVTGWKFEYNTTRTVADVQFDVNLAPGTKVWFTAFWYNPRAESGPGCTPVSALIAGGQLQQAA